MRRGSVRPTVGGGQRILHPHLAGRWLCCILRFLLGIQRLQCSICLVLCNLQSGRGEAGSAIALATRAAQPPGTHLHGPQDGSVRIHSGSW